MNNKMVADELVKIAKTIKADQTEVVKEIQGVSSGAVFCLVFMQLNQTEELDLKDFAILEKNALEMRKYDVNKLLSLYGSYNLDVQKTDNWFIVSTRGKIAYSAFFTVRSDTATWKEIAEALMQLGYADKS